MKSKKLKEGIPKEQILCECPFLDCEVNMKKEYYVMEILIHGDMMRLLTDVFRMKSAGPDNWLPSWDRSTQLLKKDCADGRTVFEDPLNEGMSGLSYLYPCMMSHSPLDFMVVMLGTNDCKARFGLTPRNIACGMKDF